MPHPINIQPNNSVFSTIEVFSAGKKPPRNEDFYGHNADTLVLSDGATDKSGQFYDGKTGGELASALVVAACLKSAAYGEALVDEITDELHGLYTRINPRALTDSAFRFAATVLAVKVTPQNVVITAVGDSPFRVNGTDVYAQEKLIDTLTAGLRRHYIERTEDVAGGREIILPILKMQHQYQNNAKHPLGFGVIDGTPVPGKFVHVYTFPRSQVHTLELTSDGYYGAFPVKASISAYESIHQTIQHEDPYKFKDFPSTKTSDDRTVLIAHFKNLTI